MPERYASHHLLCIPSIDGNCSSLNGADPASAVPLRSYVGPLESRVVGSSLIVRPSAPPRVIRSDVSCHAICQSLGRGNCAPHARTLMVRIDKG